jgi:hypothetical protein
MFERIVFRELPRRAARRGWYSLFASAVQGALLGSALWASALPTAPEEPDLNAVEVRFFPGKGPGRRTVAAAVPRAARPPGAPRGAGAAGRGVAKLGPAPAPMALVQPRTLPAELRMPAPGEIGDGLPFAADLDEGDEDGVIGGGSFEEAEETAIAAAGGIEEAPQWYAAGFRRPEESAAGCVVRNIRLPADLTGFVSPRLTVKFSVGRDGAVREVLLLSEVPDRRIAAAIEAALHACRFTPGADARGRPVNMWVILPLRFVGG